MARKVNITLSTGRTFSWQNANWCPDTIGRAAIMSRFWSLVNRRTADECWVYQGYVSDRGYGHFSIGHQRIGAHRFAWLVSRGDIPTNRVVCHNCDNTRCVNPSHLRLDTQKGNLHESVRKGRKRTWGVQKLNAEHVREIRLRAAAGQPQQDIAAVFGISRNHVSSIVHRTSWAHLTAGERIPRDPLLEARALESCHVSAHDRSRLSSATREQSSR